MTRCTICKEDPCRGLLVREQDERWRQEFPDLMRQLESGKLEQHCQCGTIQAAGSMCNGCGKRPGPEAWKPNRGQRNHTEAQKATWFRGGK